MVHDELKCSHGGYAITDPLTDSLDYRGCIVQLADFAHAIIVRPILSCASTAAVDPAVKVFGHPRVPDCVPCWRNEMEQFGSSDDGVINDSRQRFNVAYSQGKLGARSPENLHTTLEIPLAEIEDCWHPPVREVRPDYQVMACQVATIAKVGQEFRIADVVRSLAIDRDLRAVASQRAKQRLVVQATWWYG